VRAVQHGHHRLDAASGEPGQEGAGAVALVGGEQARCDVSPGLLAFQHGARGHDLKRKAGIRALRVQDDPVDVIDEEVRLVAKAAHVFDARPSRLRVGQRGVLGHERGPISLLVIDQACRRVEVGKVGLNGVGLCMRRLAPGGRNVIPIHTSHWARVGCNKASVH